jgi:hypothetical protein
LNFLGLPANSLPFALIRGQTSLSISGVCAICGYSGFPWPPLKIYRNETLGLALKAHIAHWCRPSPRFAIVFESAILHRCVLALADVVQHNP